MSYDPVPEQTVRKNVANGYAGLDSNSYIPVSVLPLMSAPGSSATPGLAPDPGSTAGTYRFLAMDGVWRIPEGGIVAGIDVLNQTSTVSSTNLTSGTTDGQYRVAAYCSITTAGTSGNLNVLFSWTYEGTSYSQTVTVNITTAGNYAVGLFTMQLESSDTLSYAVSFTGTAGSVAWNLRCSVAKMVP